MHTARMATFRQSRNDPPPRPIRAPRLLRATTLIGVALLTSAAVASETSDRNKPIMVLPPRQWDAMGVASHIAVQQSASDLARVMGGLTFGLKPEEVSRRLPKSSGELHWNGLPVAKGFHEEVRLVRMPVQDAGTLRARITACFGEQSHVVLLFRNNALFRVSWRFVPDGNCPNPLDAAEQLFAAYVPIAGTIAVSTLYRAGSVTLVDVTDPGAGALVAQRMQAGGQ